MGSLLGFLCVLSALSATGFSLTCKHCFGTTTSCSGTTMTCPADYACGGSRTKTTSSGITISESYEITCVRKDECNTEGIISTPISRIKQGTSCCFTDNCTPPLPSLPQDNDRPNGLTCRTCMTGESDWCYTEDTMQCTGEENMCILMRANIYGSTKISTATRGCSTKSICSLGSKTTTHGGMNIKASVSCTSGSFGLRSSHFLPFISAIAVAKIVYF
ncbi:phospholipase A2 inhibitor NAI-like [Mixophyes fleayi]|uniref:phospholipase A2 inhibitor NAI-like n=1 Tax=Mixophyes fleayi TaxID=3061075 RepID=UPI003F4E2296